MADLAVEAGPGDSVTCFVVGMGRGIHGEGRLGVWQGQLWVWTEEDGRRTLLVEGKRVKAGERRWSSFTRRVQAL